MAQNKFLGTIALKQNLILYLTYLFFSFDKRAATALYLKFFHLKYESLYMKSIFLTNYLKNNIKHDQ